MRRSTFSASNNPYKKHHIHARCCFFFTVTYLRLLSSSICQLFCPLHSDCVEVSLPSRVFIEYVNETGHICICMLRYIYKP